MFISKAKHKAARAFDRDTIEMLTHRNDQLRRRAETSGKLANELPAERDEARAMLAKLQPVRGERGRWKSKKATELPDGLRDNEGKVEFECRSCESWSEWHADVADFDINDINNLCGGSPRCCP